MPIRRVMKGCLIGIVFGWAPSGLIALVLFSDAERDFEAAFLAGRVTMPLVSGVLGAATAVADDRRR